MLHLEEQVCAVNYARRLNELGVRQDTIYSWANDFKKGFLLTSTMRACINNIRHKGKQRYTEYYSAFTVAELGEILPNRCESYRDESGWYMQVISPIEEWKRLYPCVTEANARAVMLIYLIENGYVKVDRWIPVTEKIPKDGDVVLALSVWYGEIKATMRYINQLEIQGEYFMNDTIGCVSDITHWKPTEANK